MTVILKPGDVAPFIDLPGDAGRVSLAALKGQKVVVYFYPKDDTPGCTTEAQGFTTAAADFAAAHTVVIGVSKDTAVKHAKFRAKYKLTPLLASDAEGDVTERYGAWVQKSLYGRTYMGIERCTFLIDAAGVVQKVWRKVRVAGHVAQVLAAAQAI